MTESGSDAPVHQSDDCGDPDQKRHGGLRLDQTHARAGGAQSADRNPVHLWHHLRDDLHLTHVAELPLPDPVLLVEPGGLAAREEGGPFPAAG
mmetsp:Transcript_21467/g.44162  ORF Transcript_21467/g.44162 Transcript_21467/m.44162 type:complete len:93 (+) Transcript_21467:507-785(+)|eukprot:CAMPEP_0178502882 /NCGR_PEP_ID=MMETSP0696-20121128/17744_1 /TAXON_ID=265572 /ORGANISM="Extubocellulus spinifer, Strain CCMP396" /LENGTH=92 /DNA_ID=CAMNT_0020131975 /DNA_START=278 /DNA_END=556 /DNA_ORIENTATION=-